MSFNIEINSVGLNTALSRMDAYIREEAKTDAAEATIAVIRQLAAAGMDANGNPFSGYTPAYTKTRQKEGLQTAHKDLRASGALLDGLHFVNDMIIPSIATEKIAEGQMYHPGWAAERHSLFLLAGELAVETIEQTLAENIEKKMEGAL